MSDVRYRGYLIRHDPPPIPTRAHDWQFSHEGWDLGDTRAGSAPTLEAARREIDELEADLANLEYLGNLSSAPTERALQCVPCGVAWTGCADAAECPRCGGTAAWDALVDIEGSVEAEPKGPDRGDGGNGC